MNSAVQKGESIDAFYGDRHLTLAERRKEEKCFRPTAVQPPF